MPSPAGGDSDDGATSEKVATPSKLGRFIQTYHSFLSTFVIGVAGLVATSIWQYRQSQTAARQAASEQIIARTKADNDWRIARAEILAKNLDVLSSQSADSADRRFGVLLSLTRGSILDPELAVSYALELGKVNADYMRSVLASTAQKSYLQLEHAFLITCLQRFGVERDVQARPATLMWLFEPYLQDLYERRQWNEIATFESTSVGARLVAALVLATARTGELVSNVEQAELVRFHATRRKWLAGYMFGQSCDPECRGKLVDVMLSTYGEAQGDYDEVLQKLIQLPRSESGPAIGQLHARLLWCQVDADDLAEFRDHVLVPALTRALATPGSDRTMVEDLVGLLAMVPEPAAVPVGSSGAGGAAPSEAARSHPPLPAPPPGAAANFAAWKALMAAIGKTDDRLARAFAVRRATVRRERVSPPPMIKRINFCGAAQTQGRAPTVEP